MHFSRPLSHLLGEFLTSRLGERVAFVLAALGVTYLIIAAVNAVATVRGF